MEWHVRCYGEGAPVRSSSLGDILVGSTVARGVLAQRAGALKDRKDAARGMLWQPARPKTVEDIWIKGLCEAQREALR